MRQAYVLYIQEVSEDKADSIVKPELKSLLAAYVSVYGELTELPPPRNCDHGIPLFLDGKPVNLQPYKQYCHQRNEIKKQVKDMLQSGIVRPSMSSYSSPIVLVKKSDATWRLCVDFKELNRMTINNKYPIPMIDELLDELGGLKYFLNWIYAVGITKPGRKFMIFIRQR